MDVVVRDQKKRVILSINDKGSIAVARFAKMDERTIDYVVKIYSDVTNEDPQKLRDFLTFREDNDEFCA